MSDQKTTEGQALHARPEQPVLLAQKKDGCLLPQALVTGNSSIDAEHAQLLSCVDSLRSLCRDFSEKTDCFACAKDKRDFCEGRLLGVLGELMGFLIDHFKHEEQEMRKSLFLLVDREICEAHMEDHANISAKVQEIITVLEPDRTVSLLRELDELLHRWLSSHIMLHDVALGRWLESRGGEFNFG